MRMLGSAITNNQLSIKNLPEKMESFLNLPQGWHYGEGHAPSRETLFHALRMYEEVNLGDFKIEAFPGVWGEIEIAIHQGQRSLEVIIDSNKRVSIIFEEDDDEVFEAENMEFTEGIKKLRHIIRADFDYSRDCGRSDRWNSLEQSVRKTTISPKVDSSVFVSEIPLITVGYRLLASNA